MDVLPLQIEILSTGSKALRHFTSVENTTEESVVHSEAELPFVVLGHWLGSILVANRVLKVTLKLHFSFPLIRQDWLGRWDGRFTERSESEQRSQLIREFGKEFTNWWAGDVKSLLDPGGNQSVMGLPAISRGFDELYSRKSNSRDCFFSAKRVLGPSNGSLWLSSLIEIRDPKEFSEWNWERPKSTSNSSVDGEVEFL